MQKLWNEQQQRTFIAYLTYLFFHVGTQHNNHPRTVGAVYIDGQIHPNFALSVTSIACIQKYTLGFAALAFIDAEVSADREISGR